MSIFHRFIRCGKKINPKFAILTSNNSPWKTGKHRSPGHANITTTTAVHVIADCIRDSYSVEDAGKSSKAQQGYILYTFSPNVSPGSLIVMVPPNLEFFRTEHDFITRIHFRITDQNFELLDFRGEQLQMKFQIKSINGETETLK